LDGCLRLHRRFDESFSITDDVQTYS
jgi:hypothetical protein